MKKLTARQIASMTPEARERYEKKLKKVKRNRRILTGAVAVIAVAAVIAVFSVTLLFNVSEIKVAKTGQYYQAEEIIDASGVDIGDNMIVTDWSRVKEKVEKKLPYILSLNIKKSISGTVTFTVTDNTASMLFETENGYALADANGKVLEILSEKPKNSGLTLLKVKNSIDAEVGETISFADDEEYSLYENIRTAIENSGIDNITGIDISNPSTIYLEYQNRYRLYMGDSSDLEYKLKEAKKIIAEEDESDPTQIGEINLSILKKVYVEKLDTLEETTAPLEEETTVSKEASADGEYQDDEISEEEQTTASEEETEAEE